MRTFIGLSFTWLPNRVRPDQVLVPLFWHWQLLLFVKISTFIYIQNLYAIYLCSFNLYAIYAPLFVIVIAIIIAIAIVIITIIIIAIVVIVIIVGFVAIIVV